MTGTFLIASDGGEAPCDGEGVAFVTSVTALAPHPDQRTLAWPKAERDKQTNEAETIDYAERTDLSGQRSCIPDLPPTPVSVSCWRQAQRMINTLACKPAEQFRSSEQDWLRGWSNLNSSSLAQSFIT